VQAWDVVYGEDPQRLEPIRIPAHLIPINAPPAEDCTLEAMRTQASPDLCAESKWLIAFNFDSHRPHLSKSNRATLVQ